MKVTMMITMMADSAQRKGAEDQREKFQKQGLLNKGMR